jgi:phage-related protein
MNRKWEIIFYKDVEGFCPVDEFLETLSEKDKTEINAWIDFLGNVGFDARRPQVDYLRDGIHELRVKLSRGGSRTLYFFCYNDYIVLTNTFYKRTDKIPDSEITKALKYKQDFLSRYSKENIGDANANSDTN